MIKVTFVEPKTTTWNKWRARCIKDTDALIALAANGQSFKISSLYTDKRFKFIMIEAFHEKCAFCESGIANQQGDIEHFRPKGGVTDEHDNPIMIASPGGDVKHPGYYWLAYDFTNLLLSCQKCNQPSTTTDGRAVGKRNRFPIKGIHATKPGDDLQAEQPVLLNPTVDDPSEHLTFDPATGMIGWKTERGRVSIDIFDLNKEQYVDQRRAAYISALMAGLKMLEYGAMNLTPQAAQNRAIFQDYRDGRAPFSMAGQAAIASLRRLSQDI